MTGASSFRAIPMPARIAALPLDERGYPVPWFVAWQNCRPWFPAFDPDKLARAVRLKLCWVCGQPLGRFMAFVIGPMCTMNRISAEPPCHRECAGYSARVCPFISNPAMRRVPEAKSPEPCSAPGGVMTKDNPGGCVIWTCRDYAIEQTATGPIFRIGDPIGGVTWWTHGREATPAEAAELFDRGAAKLRRLAVELDGPDAAAAIERAIARARPYCPGRRDAAHA